MYMRIPPLHKLHVALAISGAALAVFGLSGAFMGKLDAWYSWFVVGSFLAFDFTESRVTGNSVLTCLFRHEYFAPGGIYLIYLLMTLIIDYLYGRGIVDMWLYPHFTNLYRDVIHVLIVGMPFAFFSIAAFYHTCKGLLSRLGPRQKSLPPRLSRGEWIVTMLLFGIVIVAAVYPLINYLFLDNGDRYRVMSISMVCATPSLAPSTSLLFGRGILRQVIHLHWDSIIALLITVLTCGLIHEVPNTFVWEWRYENIPFTKLEIFHINILILIFGWLYLTSVSISVKELFMTWQGRIR